MWYKIRSWKDIDSEWEEKCLRCFFYHFMLFLFLSSKKSFSEQKTVLTALIYCHVCIFFFRIVKVCGSVSCRFHPTMRREERGMFNFHLNQTSFCREFCEGWKTRLLHQKWEAGFVQEKSNPDRDVICSNSEKKKQSGCTDSMVFFWDFVGLEKKKTFRVGSPQSPFSISSSFILSFVLLPFFLNTKMTQWYRLICACNYLKCCKTLNCILQVILANLVWQTCVRTGLSEESQEIACNCQLRRFTQKRLVAFLPTLLLVPFMSQRERKQIWGSFSDFSSFRPLLLLQSCPRQLSEDVVLASHVPERRSCCASWQSVRHMVVCLISFSLPKDTLRRNLIWMLKPVISIVIFHGIY